jgi:hypothetical protein
MWIGRFSVPLMQICFEGVDLKAITIALPRRATLSLAFVSPHSHCLPNVGRLSYANMRT